MDAAHGCGWPSSSVIAAVALAFVAVGVPMGLATLDQYGPTGLLFIFIFPAIVLSLTLVGAFVAARVANPVGWLLELSGLAAAVGIFGGTYVNYDHDTAAGLPLVVPLAWLSSWTLLPAIGMLLVYVPMLFPSGRFLGPRWRALGLIGLLGVAGTIASGFTPGPLSSTPWIQNPVGIPGAGDALAVVSTLSNLATPFVFGGAVISVFVRYRRADTVERQQLKWFGLVAGIAVVAFVVSIPNNGPVSDIAWEVGLVTLVLLPVAIGIAILRYRLWDIDRIVSRTIAWADHHGIGGAVRRADRGRAGGAGTGDREQPRRGSLDAGRRRPVPAASPGGPGGRRSPVQSEPLRCRADGRQLRRAPPGRHRSRRDQRRRGRGGRSVARPERCRGLDPITRGGRRMTLLRSRPIRAIPYRDPLRP